MVDTVSYLKEWITTYLKNKDAFFKRIEKIEESSECALLIHYKDGRHQCFLILPESKTFEEIKTHQKEDHVAVVLLNNAGNRKSMVDQWSWLKEYRYLTLYFVNPLSNGEKKWVVMPYTHSKVCDETKLMQGLKAMAELVEDITNSILKEKV